MESESTVIDPRLGEKNKALGTFLDRLIIKSIESSNILLISQILEEEFCKHPDKHISYNSNIYYRLIQDQEKQVLLRPYNNLRQSVISFIYLLERNHQQKLELNEFEIEISSGEIDIDVDKISKKLLELIKNTGYGKGVNHDKFGMCLNIISFLGKIGLQNSNLTSTLIEMLNHDDHYLFKFEVAKAILNISPDNTLAIDTLENLLKSSEPFIAFRSACLLIENSSNHLDVLFDIIHLIKSSSDEDLFFNATKSLSQIKSKTQLSLVIINLKCYLDDDNYYNDFNRFRDSYQLFWDCSEKMSYPEFYRAWHNHPEILEISPSGQTAIAQTLNQQIIDLPSQLQPTEKTYPLIINAQSLEDETDNSSIAQELCNQIYAIAFPDDNIPEINNAPQLKRLIPNIKKQLETKNLALIFHNGEPNETLIKFCKKLSDSIHIKWITEQSIEIGIPLQENLVNILQNWINQLD